MKKIISILSLLIVLMCGFSYAAEVIDADETIKVNKYIKDYFRAYKKAAKAQKAYNEAIAACNSFNALKNSRSTDLRKCYCNRFNDNFLI